MRVHIIFLFACLLFALAEAEEPECTVWSRPAEAEVSSDAEFWEGVDGAEFITELDNETHDEFSKGNPKAFIMYYTTCESWETMVTIQVKK